MKFSGEITVPAPREAVFDRLKDAEFFASCVEGVQDMNEVDPTHYTAVMETKVAYIRFKFDVAVEITRIEPHDLIEAKVEGVPLGIVGRLTGTSKATLEQRGADTAIQYEIDVAPAGIELAGAEIALSAMIGRERALERALRTVDQDYDYVLLDTPPSLGLLTINAMVAAHGVIVPVQCEYLSLRGLAQLRETLRQVRDNLNPTVDIVGILPTMYDGRTIHGREAVGMLEESFGDRVFRTRIGKTIRFAEAPVVGESIMRYDPTGPAARWYRQLAHEVVEGPAGAAGPGDARVVAA